VKNAAALLDAFCAAGIAVEVTHRSKRRLFGLSGLAPLRDAVRPPTRPDPARGQGRPRLDQPDDPADSLVPTLPSAPLTPIDRRQFDYGGLEAAVALADESIRNARLVLTLVARESNMLVAAKERPSGDARLVADGKRNDSDASSHVPPEAAPAEAIPPTSQISRTASGPWT
jgi:hypothetical protein